MKAISLFSGIGVGEHNLDKIGINVVLANEVIKKRALAHRYLYPDCDVVEGDITENEVRAEILEKSKKNEIDLIIATPPCQGLSTAGKNKTVESLFDDPRNILILSALEIIDEIKPKYVIIENVPRFQKMLFTLGDKMLTLLELLEKKYSDEYEITCDILNAADFGVPQTRYRIVYRMWKKGRKWNLPDKERQVTLEEAIGNLPTLEAGESSGIKNHFARVHPENHIRCMKYTPTGQTAFNNPEHYPQKKDGSRIKGYKNSYKRMRWDFPAPTLTMRNEIISSQENVHPGRLKNGVWTDARVLTLREIFIISSLPEDLDKPENLSETEFRQVLGEGIPPLMLEKILKGIK